MNWNLYPDNPPTETGRYTVSLHRHLGHGISVSNYLAHYDSENNTWYKYDPFDDKYTPKEDITNMIVGWASDMGSFLGGPRS